MPHKHTRREQDASQFDLPPTQIARSLPVNRSNKHDNGAKPQAANAAGNGNKKRKSRSSADDAPRAFKRLMAFAQGKKTRSGLDDGTPRPKRKPSAAPSTSAPVTEAVVETTPVAQQMPTIKPGEKMTDFAARVDAALPLSGLVTKTVKNVKDPAGAKVWRTKKERQMHKLYDEWREEDKKVKEQRQEVMDEATERQLDEDLANGNWKHWTKDYSNDVPSTSKSKTRNKKKKGKGKKAAAEDLNPWKEFDKKHAEPRAGLHDVVQAPPSLLKGPGNKLKVRSDVLE